MRPELPCVRNRKTGEQGFTLAEMIISIGVLAVTGIVVLNLFLTARTLDRKAMELDRSVLLASGMIEAFKAGEDSLDFQ